MENVCDMQFTDTYIQCVLWWKLNNVMAKNGVPNINFKGFITNSAPNWNTMWIMYGNEDASELMIDNEQTYYFH